MLLPNICSMRFVFFAIVLLLSGCVFQGQPNASVASQPPSQNPAQEPAAVVSGNITEIAEPAPPPAAPPAEEANGSAVPPAATNESPSQSPEQAPAPENTTAPFPQENGSAQPASPAEAPGLEFGNGSYRIVLEDLSVIPASEEPCGIFSIRSAGSGDVLEKIFICPGDSQQWVGPDNHSFRILVVETAAGYTKEARWARVIVYG
jgi:hypothetical protein